MPNYYYVCIDSFTVGIQHNCPLYEGDYLRSLVHEVPWYEFDTSTSTLVAFKWLYKLVVF